MGEETAVKGPEATDNAGFVFLGFCQLGHRIS
jgi:hypothetical protein